MSHIVRCASCGQANSVPDLDSGKKAVCGRCKAPLEGGGQPVVLTDADFDETLRDGRPTVVDFWAAWCCPCRMIAPVLEQLAAARAEIRFGKLNVDENPRTSSTFRVQSIPLLVFFKDGKEQGRLVGAVPRSEIEAALARYLA
jgi:thioredoxin